jgi:hypothetical protein
VPILGYLDDVILIPLGIALAERLIPGPVLDECRRKAKEALRDGGPTSRTACGCHHCNLVSAGGVQYSVGL